MAGDDLQKWPLPDASVGSAPPAGIARAAARDSNIKLGLMLGRSCHDDFHIIK